MTKTQQRRQQYARFLKSIGRDTTRVLMTRFAIELGLLVIGATAQALNRRQKQRQIESGRDLLKEAFSQSFEQQRIREGFGHESIAA